MGLTKRFCNCRIEIRRESKGGYILKLRFPSGYKLAWSRINGDEYGKDA